MTRTLSSVALGVALMLSLTSCAPSDELGAVMDGIEVVVDALEAVEAAQSPEPAQPGDPGSMDPADVDRARSVLSELPVKGRAPLTGYERDEFGHGWTDVDRNGCDTRNDVLVRDLVDAVVPEGCRVVSGVLDDPYTGRVIEFVRGNDTSRLVQIDHVVPLANAWVTGAQGFTDAERVAFANDPLNLLAVDGTANQQKGAGDAATWLPPDRSFRCEYVGRQVAVKAKHGLWVTPPERDAIERVLDGCRGGA
ncbi:MAG TPA: HNH endonuclease family protein [Agromyces sp.]